MAEVTTVAEVESKESVASLETCHEHGHIGLCTRVRLHIGILCAKQLAEALACDILALVYYFTTAVVALAWITLGVLVGEDTTHSLHHLLAHEVLTGNQLDAFHLTLFLALNDVKNNRIFSHMFKC